MTNKLVTQSDVEHEVLNIMLNTLAKKISIRCDFKDIPLLLICISEALKMASNFVSNVQQNKESGIIVPKTIIKGGAN